MKTTICVLATLAAALPMYGQKYEFGVGGGGSFYQSKTIDNPRGSADAGFSNGFAITANLGHNMYSKVGGEVRYMYQQGDMKLTSGSSKATFGSQSHTVHYDFLIHATDTEATIRPYVAIGGGMKVFRGTGTEVAVQPLSNVAILTKTQQIVGLGSFGGGVKVLLTKTTVLRFDVHDYISPFPKDVITPAVNSKVSGWINNIVPTVSVTFTF